MPEQERVRERDPEPSQDNAYEASMRGYADFHARQGAGALLIKGEERPWQWTRQGRLKYYLSPHVYKDTALQEWKVFLQDIKRHSGRHTHQGGLVIYVWKGAGYTVMDGERLEWKAGDLIILPIKPGGVEHQHFNADPEQGCVWIAFIYTPWQIATAATMEQKETVTQDQQGG